MNKLTHERRLQVIRALVEGNSLRSTSRMTGVALNTIVSLLAEVGRAAETYQRQVMRTLPGQRLQVDEIWSYCGMKERSIPVERNGEDGIGDVWTWTAIDAETKLIPTWAIGKRDIDTAREFISDLASRLTGRVQLTADGLKVYVKVVGEVFGQDIDFGQLVKIYGKDPLNETRYSPAICLDCIKTKITGNPDPDHISRSYVERQNLTMRMSMRRFTRLTNAFSKKLQNHKHAVALHFLHYNCARVHKTLKTTPAKAAGVLTYEWTLDEMLWQMTQVKVGPQSN